MSVKVGEKGAISPAVKNCRRRFDVPVWQYAVKYSVFFAMFLVLWLARTGPISPFATGFYLALVFSGQSAAVLLPLYILSALVCNPGFDALISAVVASVAVTAVSVIFARLSKKLNLPAVLAAASLSQCGYVYFSVRSGESGLYTALNLIFALLFMYVSMCAVKPVFVDRLKHKPLDTELACMGIVLSVLSAGFASLEFYGVKILYIFGMLVIALSSFLIGRGAALACSVCVGLGSALFSFDIADLALFPFITAVMIMFSGALRILTALSAVMAAVVFELYFSVDSAALAYDLIALALGGALYAVLPKSWLNGFKNYFFAPDSKLAVRHLIGSGRAELSGEVAKVSAIFTEMSRSLRAGVRSASVGADEIFVKLKSGVCASCGKCADNREAADDALKKLCEAAVESGRASVSDAPFFVENDCPRAAQLISVSAEYAGLFKKRSAEAAKDNRFREDMAWQLDGVSGILNETAAKLSADSGYDTERETLLVEELNYRGVGASEAIVSKGEIDRITLIVKTETLDKDIVADTAGKVMTGAYAVESVKPSAMSGYSVVALSEKTDYDAVFAAACSSKSRAATGDTHSFIKISDTKFMMALCDGMGSGREAGKISETAIDLVESFFRAGFDSDFILKNVNRFLSYDSGESFAAFDILVCDLNTLERSIIKLGSPASYIKDGGTVARIEGSALPLGALSEVTPSVFTDTASDGQTVVFVSDGISDLFEGESLAHYVNGLSALNVKSLCEAVLCRAKELGGETRDDMTVTAVRIMRRI